MAAASTRDGQSGFLGAGEATAGRLAASVPVLDPERRRALARRLGAGRYTALIGAVAVAISLATTILLGIAFKGGVSAFGIALATVIPAVVAPSIAYPTVSMMLRLDGAERALREANLRDTLTAAYNRRHFFDLASREFARARRYGTTFSLLMIDLDDFKHINDSAGHLAGDAALCAVVDTCAQLIRSSDVLARFGGEEFVVLLPETEGPETEALAGRLCAAVAAARLPADLGGIRATISVGGAVYAGHDANLDALIKRADDALYVAKRGGKNQVAMA